MLSKHQMNLLHLFKGIEAQFLNGIGVLWNKINRFLVS